MNRSSEQQQQAQQVTAERAPTPIESQWTVSSAHSSTASSSTNTRSRIRVHQEPSFSVFQSHSNTARFSYQQFTSSSNKTDDQEADKEETTEPADRSTKGRYTSVSPVQQQIPVDASEDKTDLSEDMGSKKKTKRKSHQQRRDDGSKRRR